jgi:hypothetical protein
MYYYDRLSYGSEFTIPIKKDRAARRLSKLVDALEQFENETVFTDSESKILYKILVKASKRIKLNIIGRSEVERHERELIINEVIKD